MRAETRRLLLRGVVVWAAVAVGSYLLARPLTSLLLPLLEAMVGLMQTDYFGELSLRDVDGQPMIHMTCIVREPIRLSPAQTLLPGTRFDGGSTHTLHAILPLAILVIVLLSWPVRSVKDGWRRAARGLLAALVVLMLTTPTLLHGRVDAMLSEAAVAGAGRYGSTALSQLFVFMESGGRWLLPLLLGALALQPAGPGAERPAPRRTARSRP